MATLGVLFVSLTVLNGCSSVPDAANPVEWYRSTMDFFAGEDDLGQDTGQTARKEDAKAAPQSSGSKAFPSLSSVPDRPANGLVGDKRQRKYSSEVISRQGEPEQMLGSAPRVRKAPKQAALAPAPKAVPAVPVTPGPLTTAKGAPSFSPPSTPPSFAMTSPSGVSKAFNSGLSQRFSNLKAPGPGNRLPGLADSGKFPPMGPDRFETVVVSSSGVEIGGNPVGTTPQSSPPPRPSARTGTVEISRQGTVFRPAAPQQARASRGGVKVATIVFDNGSARLDKRDRGILRDVRRVFDQYRNKGGKVRVIGHASSRTRNMDPVKHKMVNYRVSADRADIVARELIRMGVPEQDIYVGASSDSDPLYFEFMPSGEAGNRRAEIFIDY